MTLANGICELGREDWAFSQVTQELDQHGLFFKSIYLSNIALLVHIEEDKSDKKTGPLGKKDRDYLEQLLRRISGCAEDVGFVLPVLCLVQAKEGNSIAELEKWAADQDWHRGDFSIIVLRCPMDGGAREQDCELIKTINSLLGDVDDSLLKMQLRPLELEVVIDRFESQCQARDVPDEQRDLQMAILSALQQNSAEPIEQWLEQRWSDVQRLGRGREPDDEGL